MVKKLNKFFYCKLFKTVVENNLKGSIFFRFFGLPITIYGFNAMHVAININTRYGYICFHPTMYCFGTIWPWYFYISDNATPQNAKFALGNHLY
jgi:hypothetical protein